MALTADVVIVGSGIAGAITAWAGPWAQDVRWWDRRGWARRVHLQVVVGEVAEVALTPRA